MHNEYIKLLEQRRELKAIKEQMFRNNCSQKDIDFVNREFNRISEEIRSLSLKKSNQWIMNK